MSLTNTHRSPLWFDKQWFCKPVYLGMKKYERVYIFVGINAMDEYILSSIHVVFYFVWKSTWSLLHCERKAGYDVPSS